MLSGSVGLALLSHQWLSSIAMLLLIATIAAFWWSGKRLAVIQERPDWWDAADLWAAGLAAVAMAAFQIGLLSYRPTAAASAPIPALAVRRGLMFAYATWLGAWLASIWIETETDIDTPAGLDPVADRAWDVQLGWLPVSKPEGPS